METLAAVVRVRVRVVGGLIGAYYYYYLVGTPGCRRVSELTQLTRWSATSAAFVESGLRRN